MIPPTITTVDSDWRSRVEEINKFGFKEVNLFLTCLKEDERREIYELLKRIKIVRIPFVHLRSDMEPWELDYLAKEYRTEVYNAHTNREYPFRFDYGKRKKKIYIENTFQPYDEEEVKQFAGVCLDFAHLENARVFKPDIYRRNVEVIEKYKCGCNHISPEANFSLFNKEIWIGKKHPHVLENLSQLDYLKRYPKKYFSRHIAMEMENSIEEQLEAIKYIKSILPHVR